MHYGGKPYITDDNTETDQLADYFKLVEKMINKIDADGDAISSFTELLFLTDHKEQDQQNAMRHREKEQDSVLDSRRMLPPRRVDEHLLREELEMSK